MPEAPEVAYLRDTVAEAFQGKTATAIRILKGRYKTHGAPERFQAFQVALPMKLVSVERFGKMLVFHFAGKGHEWHLVSKLGLMGWWYPTGQISEWLRGTHNIEISFGRETLCYHDTVSYGTLTFLQDSESLQKELGRLAPAFERVTVKELLRRLGEKMSLGGKPIGEAVMLQDGLVSGIGNYLKSEILYEAHISPLRLVRTLSADEWARFVTAGKRVFRRKRASIGTGEIQAYMETMRVYGKTDDGRGHRVERFKTKDNRTTYWVPDVQS
jgi:endonuclease-8